MGTDYLNTPGDATEMVTEFGIRDEHPFPVPKRLASYLEKLAVLVRPPRDPMNSEEKPTFGFPQGAVPAWEMPIHDSIMWLRAISHDLDKLSNPEVLETDATHVRVVALALDRELLRLEALFEWAQTTWKYDPAIQAAADQQAEPGSEESATSSEAPALQ